MAGFNFAIKPFSGQRRPDYIDTDGTHYEQGDFCLQCKPWSGGGKKVLASYMARYSYVTGRAGRISWKEFFICEEHGQKFMKKHGLLLQVLERDPNG